MITYGQAIEWTDRYGKQTVSTSGHISPDEAKAAALRMAEQSGWTPPRWWQFWRWNDTRVDQSR